MGVAAGTLLGQYEILAPLGAGGMGEVYRARDPRLGRDVAIKVLPAAFSADAERLRRFEQEAQAAGALNHPNVLAVHDVDTHDGSPYIVSVLLEGETLRERLSEGALRLQLEAAQPLGVARDLGGQHLERHGAAQPGVARAVDLAHPARAERRDDFVGTQGGSGFHGQRRACGASGGILAHFGSVADIFLVGARVCVAGLFAPDGVRVGGALAAFAGGLAARSDFARVVYGADGLEVFGVAFGVYVAGLDVLGGDGLVGHDGGVVGVVEPGRFAVGCSHDNGLGVFRQAGERALAAEVVVDVFGGLAADEG